MKTYYDLIVSTKVSNHLWKIVSLDRMDKLDEKLTEEEIYGILHKAITDMDKTSDQFALFIHLPSAEFSADNYKKLIEVRNGMEALGVRVELIEVLNGENNDPTTGLVSYLKSKKINTGFSEAVQTVYVNPSVSMAQVQYDIAELVIDTLTAEILDIKSIKSDIEANLKVGVPYYSEDLAEYLESYGIDYEVVGEF